VKTYPVLSSAPGREEVLGEWRYIAPYTLFSAPDGNKYWSRDKRNSLKYVYSVRTDVGSLHSNYITTRFICRRHKENFKTMSVTNIWRVLGLRMEQTTYGHGRHLRIYWVSSHGQLKRGGSLSWGLGQGAFIPNRKDASRYKMLQRLSKLAGSCEQGMKCWAL